MGSANKRYKNYIVKIEIYNTKYNKIILKVVNDKETKEAPERAIYIQNW